MSHRYLSAAGGTTEAKRTAIQTHDTENQTSLTKTGSYFTPKSTVCVKKAAVNVLDFGENNVKMQKQIAERFI